MRDKFEDVLQFMRASGDRLRERAGTLADIGITKQFVTEEDLRIERDFKAMMLAWGDGDTLYAEEENATLPDAEHVWVVDPISGTKTFLKGLPHYAIVISYLEQGEAQFAAVYDPSTQELFTAQKGMGASVNEVPLRVCEHAKPQSVVLNISQPWRETDTLHKLVAQLTDIPHVQNENSFAVNYCHVASGRYCGVISLTKDVFPEFAGSLILSEAGGVLTTHDNRSQFTANNRIFAGGSPSTHKILLEKVQDLS